MGKHNKKGRTQTICLPFPPSVLSSISPPCPNPLVHSLTYRTLLNGLKWPQGWTEPHRQMGTVWRCLSNREKGRAQERKMSSGPPEFHPCSVYHSLPFPLLWQRVTIQPNQWQRCPLCILKKEVSVSTTAWLSSFCGIVCVHAGGWGADHTSSKMPRQIADGLCICIYLLPTRYQIQWKKKTIFILAFLKERSYLIFLTSIALQFSSWNLQKCQLNCHLFCSFFYCT